MPVENERKFVLKPPFKELEKAVHEISSNAVRMEQGYLLRDKHMTVRVRGTTAVDETPPLPWYEMTVKRMVRGETIEIETEIAKEDFLKLWSVASGKLRKTRYVISGWEIDFFRDERGDTYFVQAEIELPEGVERPNALLPIIAENLLYQVKKNDNRFSSRKLGNLRYTNKLLGILLEKRKVK